MTGHQNMFGLYRFNGIETGFGLDRFLCRNTIQNVDKNIHLSPAAKFFGDPLLQF